MMADYDDLDLGEWMEEDSQEPEEYDMPEGPAEPVRRARRMQRSEAEAQQWESYEQAPSRGWGGWMKVLIPFAALMLVAVVILGVSFAYASRVAKLTTIYPNVTVNGVSVGGMTMTEAAQALGDDPAKYDNAAVTVNFPTGDSVTITAQELGLQAVDGTAYAQVAYSYGRGGSMLANLRTYRSCQDKPVELAVDGAGAAVNESVIADKIAPVAAAVDQKLSTTHAQISEEQITVVKNAGTAHVDVAALSEQVRRAFEQEDYAPIDYQVPETEPQEGESTAVDVDAMLQTLYNEVYVEPVDASYDQSTGGVIEAVQGVRFDMDAARIAWEQAASGETVTIPLIREDPEITAEDLKGQLFADVLAEKSTSLSGSTSARINNITLAAKAMNGVILQPGEEFSYNACLGQRTAAKGYQSAGAFAGGEHVMSIGGGICQGSSTLYYCAMKANLRITTRYCHQFVVGYLPRGMDATVSWGFPEFKFVNSRAYPIKIEAYVSGGYLTIRILGTDVDGSYVEITNDTWEDAAHYYAQTYRHVYDKNGNLISSTKEAYSSYDKESAIAAKKQAQQQAQQTQTQTQPENQTQTETQAPPAAPDPAPDPEPEITEPDPEPIPEPDPEPAPEADAAA